MYVQTRLFAIVGYVTFFKQSNEPRRIHSICHRIIMLSCALEIFLWEMWINLLAAVTSSNSVNVNVTSGIRSRQSYRWPEVNQGEMAMSCTRKLVDMTNAQERKQIVWGESVNQWKSKKGFRGTEVSEDKVTNGKSIYQCRKEKSLTFIGNRGIKRRERRSSMCISMVHTYSCPVTHRWLDQAIRQIDSFRNFSPEIS